MSGRSWITTLPPFDSSSVQRFAGLAATSAGAVSATGGLGGGSGAAFAAINANARKGKAIRLLIILHSPQMPLRLSQLRHRRQTYFRPSLAATSAATS